ncbi:uncharacterized protein LOC111333003 [Stylophora pistillata]|uniref:uncharacterized protein LOC111333003 n=1 Tax=Stylophora pistillata TaxID=50429 RepID=UPI000C050114|nr:uncharacterized protein LOC111333003 [Stylophora pistillata]
MLSGLASIFQAATFILATKAMLISAQDKHCSSLNETLSYSQLIGMDCQQCIGQWRQNWHRIICRNETDTSIDRGCCESWCEQLASCFRQSSNWTSCCKQMWRCRNPRKKLSINTTDSLYFGSIKVKHCWARGFTAIKLTTVIKPPQFPNKKLVDTIL